MPTPTSRYSSKPGRNTPGCSNRLIGSAQEADPRVSRDERRRASWPGRPAIRPRVERSHGHWKVRGPRRAERGTIINRSLCPSPQALASVPLRFRRPSARGTEDGTCSRPSNFWRRRESPQRRGGGDLDVTSEFDHQGGLRTFCFEGQPGPQTYPGGCNSF